MSVATLFWVKNSHFWLQKSGTVDVKEDESISARKKTDTSDLGSDVENLGEEEN